MVQSQGKMIMCNRKLIGTKSQYCQLGFCIIGCSYVELRKLKAQYWLLEWNLGCHNLGGTRVQRICDIHVLFKLKVK